MLPIPWIVRWSSYRFYPLDEAGPMQVNVGLGEISFRDRVAAGFVALKSRSFGSPVPALRKLGEGRGTHRLDRAGAIQS